MHSFQHVHAACSVCKGGGVHALTMRVHAYAAQRSMVGRRGDGGFCVWEGRVAGHEGPCKWVQVAFALGRSKQAVSPTGERRGGGVNGWPVQLAADKRVSIGLAMHASVQSASECCVSMCPTRKRVTAKKRAKGTVRRRR